VTTGDTEFTFGGVTTPVVTREWLQYFPAPLPATAEPLLIRENQRFITFPRPHFSTV
jgi:hypothetical protein